MNRDYAPDGANKHADTGNNRYGRQMPDSPPGRVHSQVIYVSMVPTFGAKRRRRTAALRSQDSLACCRSLHHHMIGTAIRDAPKLPTSGAQQGGRLEIGSHSQPTHPLTPATPTVSTTYSSLNACPNVLPACVPSGCVGTCRLELCTMWDFGGSPKRLEITNKWPGGRLVSSVSLDMAMQHHSSVYQASRSSLPGNIVVPETPCKCITISLNRPSAPSRLNNVCGHG